MQERLNFTKKNHKTELFVKSERYLGVFEAATLLKVSHALTSHEV
jgi:hypothetical protein